MASIPIELDKLFGIVPARQAAEPPSGPDTSFRQHLEQSRPSSNSGGARDTGPPRPEAGPSSEESCWETQPGNRSEPSASPPPAGSSEEEDHDRRDSEDTPVVAAGSNSAPIVDAPHAEPEDARPVDADQLLLEQTKQAGQLPTSAVATQSRGALQPATSTTVPVKVSRDANAGDGTAVPAARDADPLATVHQKVVGAAAVAPIDAKTKGSRQRGTTSKEDGEKNVLAARKPAKAASDLPSAEDTSKNARPIAGEDQVDRTPRSREVQMPDHVGPLEGPTLQATGAEPNPTNPAEPGRDAAEKSSTRELTGAATPADNSAATSTASGAVPSARLPAHLISRAGDRTTSGTTLTEAEQGRFLQRVARAFQAAQDRDGEVRLRLSPPELGSLRLEVKISGGVLNARLGAETPEARSLLIDNLPVLRERLAEQGIRIENFDVDLLDRQTGGGTSQNLPQGQDRGTDVLPPARPAPQSTALEPQDSTAKSPLRRLDDGRLNVII